MGPRLITIPISHYCEKARWALQRAGVPFREEPHVQGIHRVVARRSGGTTVPVLVTAEGSVTDSADIIHWADARTPVEHRLYPVEADERAAVERLCRRFDEVLGPHGRRLIYVHVFARPDGLIPFNNRGVPRWEDRAIRWAWPAAVFTVSRVLGIEDGSELIDEPIVWREFDRVAQLLADGREHLCGDRFTAADLTFAALAAPVIAPPSYGVPLPQPEDLPARTAALVRKARVHPAGAYALRVYDEHRHERVSSPGAATDARSGAPLAARGGA